MPRVDRSNLAETDLLAISEHLALDNPSAAARWLEQIEEEFLRLAKKPFHR
jgi:plasmid stabilization system protein ParE